MPDILVSVSLRGTVDCRLKGNAEKILGKSLKEEDKANRLTQAQESREEKQLLLYY